MTSRLAEMQARFQQRQMQEKEEKLLKLYESQQQKAFDRVSRGSAGSNTSVGSTGGGKVRQMFDERRQKAGIDKSYPLEPLKSKTTTPKIGTDRKSNVSTTSRTTIKTSVQKSVSSIRNGKPVTNKREVMQSIYNNNDGDVSYEEKIYQDSSDDIFNSNPHKNLIEMMNNHNINDSLDNEVLPQIGFDEVDDASVNETRISEVKPVQNGVVKKVEARQTLKTNGVTSPVKKERSPAAKKPVKAPTPVRPTPSPAKSPRNSNPPSPEKTPTPTMSARPKSTTGRAPSNTRPSAKQSAKSGVARDDLVECNYCGRRFAADRLQKHEDICSKTGKKKRKQYDATKHRVVGTELEAYVLRGNKNKSITSTKSKSSSKKDWRKTHEEFIAAIRAAKQTQAHIAKGGKLSDLPPPPPSSNPDYVQCPHCGRRFNQAAAERHIPKCASYQFNKPKPKAPARR